MNADKIKHTVDSWRDKASQFGSKDELVESFIDTFTKKDVLDITDYFVDNISPYAVDAYNNGGAVHAAIAWVLPTQGFRIETVDRIKDHFGLDYTTVSPRCALRKALCARLFLRKADEQLGKMWPVNVDLINAIVCKLNDEQDVYDLSTDVLDTVLSN